MTKQLKTVTYDPETHRSEQLIVEQTESIAALLANNFHGSVLDGKYWESKSPKAKLCWAVACEIQEILTQTDVMNAVANIEENRPRVELSDHEIKHLNNFQYGQYADHGIALVREAIAAHEAKNGGRDE